MSNPENFFDNVGGSGAPSAQLKNVDDFVMGEVVEQFMAPAIKFGTDEQERDSKTGEPVEQLVIILQTDLTNWAGVSRIPKVDKDDKSSADKPGSDDDGRRAVYVKPYTNIHAAIGAAVREANGGKAGPVRNGAKLGVKVTELKDVNKGNPLKIHKAVYEPPAAPSASEAFFGGGEQAPAATQAPAAQQSPSPAATQEQAAPAAEPARDPWGAPASGSKAPF